MLIENRQRTRPLDTVIGSALLKHVSAEGCQLLLESNLLTKGMRMTICDGSSLRVTGRVRWTVDTRAGFAFDTSIGQDVQAALRRGRPGPTSVTLHPA